jgi:hypothetical protein
MHVRIVNNRKKRKRRGHWFICGYTICDVSDKSVESGPVTDLANYMKRCTGNKRGVRLYSDPLVETFERLVETFEQ